jgi:predicted ABC-type exoprotein transport system permease subunit
MDILAPVGALQSFRMFAAIVDLRKLVNHVDSIFLNAESKHLEIYMDQRWILAFFMGMMKSWCLFTLMICSSLEERNLSQMTLAS